MLKTPYGYEVHKSLQADKRFKIWAGMLVSFVAAGAFSTGLAFVADRFDPSFRTAEDVIGYLGMSVLASLPAPIDRQRGEP